LVFFFCIAELLKEAERIRHAGSRNPKEKIDIYHEAAEACRSVGNCFFPLTENQNRNYFYSGKYDEAIKYFTLELREAQSADLREDILYCHRFLGECYFAKNEFHTSEKHHLNFLSSAQEYADDERTEQAYICLAHTYWVWLSYLQDDVLHDPQCDQLPREICKRSLDAAKNSLLMIEKLDYQLKIDMKNKQNIKIKDLEKRQQDLALRRVRAYINIGK
jgi:tetratricopeptide (TPR) repeat protein